MFKNRNLVLTLGFIGMIVILLFALNWAFHSLALRTITGASKTPIPTQPQENSATPLPTATMVSYDFLGTKLYLAQSLPNFPAEANVYLLNKDKPATLDEARALAARFGIQSETYIASGDVPSENGFIFTDGKQMLTVHSNFYFNYISDIVKNYNNLNISSNPTNAEEIISEFLKTHGFDFAYQIEGDGLRGGYDIRPTSPDGLPMQYEYFGGPVMNITLDENGQVLNVQSSLMDYSQASLGTFGIISAEEALQRMLDDNVQAGKIEGMSSASKPIHGWKRTYPTNQAITICGYRSVITALDPNQPPFIQIDAYPIFGNIDGLAQLRGNGKQADIPYIEAVGQFVVENGIEKFNVASWKISDSVESSWVGTLNRENGQVTLSADPAYEGGGGNYLLPNVPEDVPMPFEHAFVVGTKIGNMIEWKLIDDRMTSNGGGGGGGGGGLGFYQLNLSGTPVSFPTSTPTPQVSNRGSYVVKAGDTLPGIASSFGISVDALMQANGLNDPRIFAGQTLVIPTSAPSEQQHQFLTGTQKVIQTNNQTIILFTTEDGTTYAQADPNGNLDNAILIGKEGDKVSLDAVINSDKQIDGYPTLLVYGAGLTGQWGGGGGGGSTENPSSTSNESNTPTAPENYIPPSLTVEKVELVYIVSNPLYQANDPTASRRSPYIQPAWHFSGHYSNGDTYDIVIQALKQEFLSPGIAPYVQGG